MRGWLGISSACDGKINKSNGLVLAAVATNAIRATSGQLVSRIGQSPDPWSADGARATDPDCPNRSQCTVNMAVMTAFWIEHKANRDELRRWGTAEAPKQAFAASLVLAAPERWLG